MNRLLTVSIGALALASCKQATSGASSPVTEGQALDIAQATESAFGSGDVNRIASHYAGNILMFDAANAAPSSNPKVIKGWTQQFVSMKPADYQVADRKIQLVGPDAFVNSGIGSFTVQAGAVRPTVTVRFTQVYQRQKDGQWRIVTEHMSMPPAPTGSLPTR